MFYLSSLISLSVVDSLNLNVHVMVPGVPSGKCGNWDENKTAGISCGNSYRMLRFVDIVRKALLTLI